MTTISPHAENAYLVARDVHALLLRELNLLTPFRSTDPGEGEAYGNLSTNDFADGKGAAEKFLSCTFLASAGFNDYWEAQKWAIGTKLNLDHLLPKVSSKINRRGILSSVERSSNISGGNPRAPLQQPNGHSSHLWIVDVLCPLRLKLMIYTNPISGHK